MPTDYKLDGDGDLDLLELAIKVYATEEETLRQRLQIRLRLIQGEYHLNILSGVPYLGTPFTDKGSKVAVDNLLKNYIINTPGVVELLEYSSEINDRALSVSFKVSGETGAVVNILDLEIT